MRKILLAAGILFAMTLAPALADCPQTDQDLEKDKRAMCAVTHAWLGGSYAAQGDAANAEYENTEAAQRAGEIVASCTALPASDRDAYAKQVDAFIAGRKKTWDQNIAAGKMDPSEVADWEASTCGDLDSADNAE